MLHVAPSVLWYNSVGQNQTKNWISQPYPYLRETCGNTTLSFSRSEEHERSWSRQTSRDPAENPSTTRTKHPTADVKIQNKEAHGRRTCACITDAERDQRQPQIQSKEPRMFLFSFVTSWTWTVLMSEVDGRAILSRCQVDVDDYANLEVSDRRL